MRKTENIPGIPYKTDAFKHVNVMNYHKKKTTKFQ